jgi:hypothetical protein
MSKTYHVKFLNDYTALTKHQELTPAIKAAGGDAQVARSYGNGPAFVVIHLPEDVDPKAVLEGEEFTDPEEEQSDDAAESTGDSAGDDASEEGDEAGTESEEAAPVGSPEGSAE